MPYTAEQMVVQIREAKGQFTLRARGSKKKPTFTADSIIQWNQRIAISGQHMTSVLFIVVTRRGM